MLHFKITAAYCPLHCDASLLPFGSQHCHDAVLRIRIHRIHMFLGLQDPDPLVRGMDPDPSIIMQK
jgi:hypothetical protein